MSIKMVRTPSETPNISNTDDFVGLRYAFGNQNGYVIWKGQECSYTINGSKFKINSGRLVLQGVECDVDASGVEITVDNIATKRFYTVYLQVNLALNETKILATFDTVTYPNIDSGDDLTQNTTGVARIKLYQFDAINGVISNVQKTVNGVKYGYAENSKKVNGLEIIRDENGVLKIGDIIVPQKKVILKNVNLKNTTMPGNSAYIHLTIPNVIFELNKHYKLYGYWKGSAYLTDFVYDLYTPPYTGDRHPSMSMNVIAAMYSAGIKAVDVNVSAAVAETDTELTFAVVETLSRIKPVSGQPDEQFLTGANNIVINDIYEIIE